MMPRPPATVSIDACPPPGRIAPLWQALERRAEAPPFLSWPWIAALLDAAPPGLRLIRISVDERLVGLGMLGNGTGGLFLNESGDPELDAVMIEYNGLLAERGYEALVRNAFLTAARDWGRLHLSGIAAEWREEALRLGLVCRLRRHPQPVPVATLAADRDPLTRLSRNTRQQFRRSFRFFEESGPVRLERAGTAAEARAWFDALERMHTAAWRARGQAGAFGSPAFGPFHRRLIARDDASGGVDLLRLRAGETILGYLYNLVGARTVYAYQSGFLFGNDAKSRPGLVAHVLAMQDYRSRGLTAYNFLAGASPAKARLSDREEILYWAEVSRKLSWHGLTSLALAALERPRTRLEHFLERHR